MTMLFARALCFCAVFALPAFAGLADTPAPAAESGILAFDRAQATPAWQAFGRESGWSAADWDRHHAFPHRAFGPAIDLPGGAIADAADLDARLRDFMAAYPGLLSGGKHARPQDLAADRIERRGEVWYADYSQRWNGARVLKSEVVFRVSPEGRLLLAGSDAHPEIRADEPRLDASEIAARLWTLGSADDAVTRVDVEAGWVLLPRLEGKAFRYDAAWPAQVDFADPEQKHQLFVSAADGEILWSWNRVRHVEASGTLTGLVEEQQPSDADLPQPLAHLDLEVDGQPVRTAPDGSFTVEVAGEAPWTVTGQLRGAFANVNRQDGPDAQFVLQLQQGGETVELGLDQAQIQEVDAYLHTSRVHDFITDMDPGFTGLNEDLPVNININQTCNAYWDGNSINFFQEGGGCPNTGRVAGVIYHEYGHGINDRQYLQAGAPWGLTNGAMHEGLADVTAIYMQDEDFVSPGWFIRDLDNTNSYPDNIQGEVHYDGLIIGGAMYDLRVSLGLDAVRPMHHFARWGMPDDSDMGRACFEYFFELLLVDDDNGDLGDLTPDYAAIDAAFNAHGVGSVLTWTAATFTLEQAPFVTQPMVDLPIEATLESPAFVVPQSVEARWWTAAADTQSVFLDDQGDGLWTGAIPGQPWNTVVSYYVRVNNPAGVEILSPPGAPAQAWRTRFAFEPGLLIDFENDAVGTASNEVWEWGVPFAGPDEAWSGDRVWGTVLSGNYPANSVSRLTLPERLVIDDQQVAVTLMHWMDFEENWDGGNAEISVNGGAWTLIEPLTGYDFVTPDNNALPGVPALTGSSGGWQRLSFDITGQAQPGDRVRLRFNLLSDGLVEASGWYLDDLAYLGFEAPASIAHDPLPDSEDTQQAAFDVHALVRTQAEVESVVLRWRVDGGADAAIAMVDQGGDEWLASLPGPFDQQTVEYRIEAQGAGGFSVSLPSDPAEWLSFFVGPDLEAPAVAFLRPPTDAVGHSALWTVVAAAEDNLGLAEVRLQVLLDGVWEDRDELAEQEDGSWAAEVDFHEGDELASAAFRLRAVDGSAAGNEALSEIVEVSLGQEERIDDFEAEALSDWIVSGNWSVQGVRVHSGEGALGTTADGFYEAGENGVAEWRGRLDLRHVDHPVLRLWEQWFIEEGDDVARLEISADGQEWERIVEHTGGSGWHEGAYPLEEWVGLAGLRLRFVFEADGDDDGWHIGYYADDLVVINEETGVDDPAPAGLPTAWSLGEPWPNPFNPSTRVALELSRPAELRLSVVNLLGQEVAVLHDGPLAAGASVFLVDGSALGSGLYLLRAEGAGRAETRKLLLVK